MMPFGTQVEMLFHQLGELVVGNLAGAEGVHHQADGTRHSDRVGHLHFATAGELGSDDILGDVARGIRSGAIDFGWVLAGKCATRRGARNRRSCRR